MYLCGAVVFTDLAEKDVVQDLLMAIGLFFVTKTITNIKTVAIFCKLHFEVTTIEIPLFA